MARKFTNVSTQQRDVLANGTVGSRRIPAGAVLEVQDAYAEGYRNQPNVWREEEDPAFAAPAITGAIGSRTGLPIVAPSVQAAEVGSSGSSEAARPNAEANLAEANQEVKEEATS